MKFYKKINFKVVATVCLGQFIALCCFLLISLSSISFGNQSYFKKGQINQTSTIERNSTSDLIVHYEDIKVETDGETKTEIKEEEPIIENEVNSDNNAILIIVAGVVCFTGGLLISLICVKRFLKPINNLKDGAHEVAKGNFEIQIPNERKDEMGVLIDDFNEMINELRKNEVLKSDFITNVSHEFKTPLSTIQGYATLLQDETLNQEERDKYVKIIMESTSQLSSLVSYILKISKIENSTIQLKIENYELDESIRESILKFENEWTNKNISLDIDLDDIRISSDRILLDCVWSNLISNAIKYSKDNGNITIKLVKENGLIKFTIADDGIGISEENLERIFDKFYQEDKSRNTAGYGLGLPLAQKIITLLKGNIIADSKKGKGSIFTVTLPLKFD